MTAEEDSPFRRQEGTSLRSNQNRSLILLYILPALLLMTSFIYYPLVQNFIYSFYRWSAFSSSKVFIAFDNYKRLFLDPVFYIAVKNNVLYALVSVLCQCGIGLIIAAALEEKFLRRYQRFFRTVYFIPAVISMTVIGLLWQLIYNPNIGIVNAMLDLLKLGRFAHEWLGDSNTAIYAIILVSQWQYTGYIMLLYLVAMQKIPAELYESARIDGAGPTRCFFSITIPQIKEMIVVCTVITIIGSFKLFDEIYVMTAGGPGRSTEVLATAMYRSGFRNDEMGYAAAFAVVLFLITFIFTLIQLKVSRTSEE